VTVDDPRDGGAGAPPKGGVEGDGEPRSDEAGSEQSREAIRKRVLEELEAEHDQRMEQLEARKEKARARTHERKEREKEVLDRKFKEELRAEFYRERGYVEYVDRSGRRTWVPKEEYEWRMRRRKASRKRDLPMNNQTRQVLFYAATVIIALVIGLMLVKK
jgi:hypothetical protein